MKMNVKDLWTVFKKSFLEWQDDNAPLLAAAISYFTIFSILPIFILAINVAGLFMGSEPIRQEIFRQIQTIYSTRAAESIQTLIESSQDSGAGVASLFSGILLLFLGSKVFLQLQHALNVIWKGEPNKSRFQKFFIKRAFSFVMLLAVGGFIFFFFIVDAAFQFLSATVSDYFPQFKNVFMFEIVSQSTSIALFSLLFAFAYRFVPDRKVQWKDVWLGSIVTAVLFGVGRYLFTFYFGKIDLSSTYGAAGSILVILVWVYFSAHIFLYGAKFTYIYAKELGSLQTKKKFLW